MKVGTRGAPAFEASTFILAGATALFFFASWSFASFTAEDAYITARHATNLVAAGTLSFNAQDHVSALTSPLHALVEAALGIVAGSILPANKLLSVAAFAFATWIALRRTAAAATTRLAWATLVLASPAVTLWMWGGLETPYLFLLATALAERTLAPGPWDARRVAVIHVLAGLAFLTRYDAAIFAAPLVVHSWGKARRPAAIFTALALGAVAPILWLLFAQRTYGDIFPTPFYVKRPDYSTPAIAANSAYLGAWLLASGVIPWAAALFVTRRPARGPTRGEGRNAVDSFAVVVALLASLVYATGMATGHMMFAFRSFVPYLGATALVLGRMAPDVTPRTRADHALVVTAAAVLALQLAQTFAFDRRSLNGIVPWGEYRNVGVRAYSQDFVPALLQAGHALERDWAKRAVRPDRAPRVLTFAGGALPYAARHAYVYEQLASYRHNWAVSLGSMTVYGKRVAGPDGALPPPRVFDAARAADYLHVMTPRHGALDRQIPGALGDYEIVSRADLAFDGRVETILILYNPHPEPHALPSTLSGRAPGP